VKVLGEGVDKFREMKAPPTIDENLARSLQHMDALAKLAARIGAEMKSWGSSLTVHVLPVLETILSTVEPIVEGSCQRHENRAVRGTGQKGLERIRHTLDLVREARKEAEGPLRITVNKPSGVKFPRQAPARRVRSTSSTNSCPRLMALRQAELDMVGRPSPSRRKRANSRC
jgi:hypothetical protein